MTWGFKTPDVEEGVGPQTSAKLKDDIRFKIETARQCQLGRRSRPPQSLPSSWHSLFQAPFFQRFRPQNIRNSSIYFRSLHQLRTLPVCVLNDRFLVEGK